MLFSEGTSVKSQAESSRVSGTEPLSLVMKLKKITS